MGQQNAAAWTREEIAILQDVFPREGINGAADALADRSWKAINTMASKFGIRSGKLSDAPEPKLQGARLEEAIRLRQVERWSFARIGATFGVCEAAACNAVLIALCPRMGFTPAQRDEHGRLTPEGLERLRLMLKVGAKGVDIQLQLGVSAACVAEQRRRYATDLKARRKAPLPPPGGGAAYSGVKIPRSVKREIENLYLDGLGAQKIGEKTGVSRTSILRIKQGLVTRLRRQGRTLPGCDEKGVRRAAAKESSRYITAETIEELRRRLRERQPVLRIAREVGISSCSAYRLRDQYAAELGDVKLPKPILPGCTKAARLAHRSVVVARRQAEAPRVEPKVEPTRIEPKRPLTFEEQLARVAAGAAVVTAFKFRRADPTMTLGGVATGLL